MTYDVRIKFTNRSSLQMLVSSIFTIDRKSYWLEFSNVRVFTTGGILTISRKTFGLKESCSWKIQKKAGKQIKKRKMTKLKVPLTLSLKSKIISCSSQTKENPVTNLLSPEYYRFWQTDGNADKAVVELEFKDGPTKISHLEIGLLILWLIFQGNAGSAFIEVLVGNAKDDPEKYSVCYLLF
jgi:hypothetical protein